MVPFLQQLIEAKAFSPIGECYSWHPQVVFFNVLGDGLIAFTYFLAPLVLFYLSRRRRFLIERNIFIVFTIFIWFCGLRHVLEIIAVWVPIYYLQGIFKIITGLLAITTLTLFFRSLPQVLGIDKTNSLEKINARLLEEIAERERAQVALRQANEVLETRVQQRTARLIQTNRELEKEIETRKATEHNLLEKNKELTRINSELDNFVYHASHDLKDPIVKIEGLVTALKEELPQVNPNVNAIFQHLDGSLLKVDKTVLDLTEVGRIQKCESLEAYEEVDIEEVCREVRTELEDQLAQANASINTNFEKAPRIYFSRQNLKRICSNLLLNALHMRNPNKPLKLDINTEPSTDHVTIRITDNGFGLAFPGQQAPKDLQVPLENSHEAGFGLSLYIVQRILNNCNGQLKVQSAPGTGCIFEVLLPSTIHQA